MDIENIREYCLTLTATTEDMPFGDDCVTYRLMGKIFCCISLNDNHTVSLKCEADYSETLRETYTAIEPAWHWNKKYWIQIDTESDEITDDFMRQLIDHSYNAVKKKLTKAQRTQLDTYIPTKQQ